MGCPPFLISQWHLCPPHKARFHVSTSSTEPKMSFTKMRHSSSACRLLLIYHYFLFYFLLLRSLQKLKAVDCIFNCSCGIAILALLAPLLPSPAENSIPTSALNLSTNVMRRWKWLLTWNWICLCAVMEDSPHCDFQFFWWKEKKSEMEKERQCGFANWESQLDKQMRQETIFLSSVSLR